jgi:flagellar hook-associated protein 2
MSTYSIINGTGIQLIPAAEIPTTSYNVEVTQVAQAQTLTSAAFSSEAQLGNGTLNISVNSQSVEITIDSTNDTIAGIIQAINASPLSQHLIAYALPGTDGTHLILACLTTGVSNVINITVSNVSNDNGISSLSVTSTTSTMSSIYTPTSWTQTFAACDAALTVNGVAIDSPTNMIKDVIPNYTLVVNQQAVGITQTIQI